MKDENKASYEVNVAREPFWEEMTAEQRINKLAQAVEILGQAVIDLERDNAILLEHSHMDGRIVVSVIRREEEQPWYKRHLLNRMSKGGTIS